MVLQHALSCNLHCFHGFFCFFNLRFQKLLVLSAGNIKLQPELDQALFYFHDVLNVLLVNGIGVPMYNFIDAHLAKSLRRLIQ